MTRLESIRRGPRPAPDRVLLVGTEGIGKSTWASEAPSPVFVAAEDGLRALDVASFPERATFGDVIADLEELLGDGHDFETVVVDSVDWLEPMIWAETCRKHGWDNIEKPGYGKGYVAAGYEWRRLVALLDRLRHERGLEVVLIAHAAIRTFANPTGDDYARYEVALNKNASGILKQWADSVLFATYEEQIEKVDGRAKARATGRRVVHTLRTAGWDAKSRHHLPPELEMSYTAYAEARGAADSATCDELVGRAETLLEELATVAAEDELVKIRDYFASNGKNRRRLLVGLERLEAKVAEVRA